MAQEALPLELHFVHKSPKVQRPRLLAPLSRQLHLDARKVGFDRVTIDLKGMTWTDTG